MLECEGTVHDDGLWQRAVDSYIDHHTIDTDIASFPAISVFN